MGSGSFGGGGGSGGGGGGARLGGYRFKFGKLISRVPQRSETEKTLRNLRRRKLPRDYVLKMFGSPMVRALYEELFEFSVHIFQNRSWSGIASRYGVPAGRGCLLAWINKVVRQAGESEPNSKISDTARLALEDFLVAALGNNLDLYTSGSDKDVLNALDKKKFDSTSAYFLGFLIRRTLERELETAVAVAEQQVRPIAQNVANEIVRNFENKFHAKGQTTHRDLFRIIQEQPGWFLKQFRQ
jgi:hypothetical protein